MTPLDIGFGVFEKTHVVPVRRQSLSHMEQRIEQAIAAVSCDTLQKVFKNVNSKIIHISIVNGTLIEEHNIYIYSLGTSMIIHIETPGR